MSPAGLPARPVTLMFFRSRRAHPSPPPSNRGFALVAVGLVALWTAACGDGGTGPAPAPPNQAPVRVGAIPAQTLGVGETAMVNVAGYFNDPGGDALTYTAASSNAATASVAVVGSVVTITAVAQGVASVTVTARDTGGLSAQQTMTVAVPNRGPTAVGTIPAQTVFGGETGSVDVSAFFNDPDGDALTYSAASSNATVASASVTGSVVSLEAGAQGMATVTVTARDPGGLSVQQSFAVTVPNRAPAATGTIPDQTLSVGQMFRLDVSAYFNDPDGDALNYTVSSANSGVVSVMIAGSTVTIAGVAPGTTTVTVTAADPGGMSGQQMFAVTVPNRGPASVGTIPAQSVVLGQTVTVDVSPFFSDPDGETLSYTAASSNTGVATVATAGSSITVAGVAAGTVAVTVTATDSGQLSAQQRFSVTVRAANQAPEVVSTISDLTLTIGETRDWRGTDHFRDPNGDPLTYAVASSNAAVVRATASASEFGIVALSPGTATVTVTARDPGSLSARISFLVTVQPETQAEVVISGVEPTVLVEGQEARITGSGFSATAVQNQVSVGGRGARVTAATRTSLTIMVPRADCLSPRREELRVAVGSESDARTVRVTPRSLETEPGNYWYTYGGNGCLHLAGNAPGGEYLIGVVSSSEDPASLTGFTLTGTPWDASAVGAEGGRIVVAAERGAVEEMSQSATVALAQGPFRSTTTFDQEPVSPMTAASVGGDFDEWPLADDTLRMRRARAHNEIMARNEALLRRLGRATRPALADARRELQVGDTLTLYADFPEDGTCTYSGQVRAVVRLVGNSSIWLDDRDNPAATFTDSELATLDAFYSANVKDVHDDYFGGLSDVDGNDRFLVLMTKEVNRTGTVRGWVWPGDLYRSARCATSNQAEIFYGMVPDPQGSMGDEVTKQELLDYYPELIAHEVTHLVQNKAQVFENAGRKTAWEDEGGATLAEQLVANRLFGHGSGQELSWAAYNHSAESRNWYSDWLGDMAHFFGWDHRGSGTGRIAGAPEECSWVGRPDAGNSGPCLLDGREVYGVPSMVLRYAMDRWGGDYPGGERALMRRFTQSPARSFATLVDVSPDKSWRPEAILTDFYIALWIDLQGGQAYGMTTWDLHDIFTNVRENARLQPYTSSSPAPRLTGRRVRAGSTLYFHWTPTGALSPTSIKVTSPGGGRLPDHISVWALRVR